MSGTVQGSRGGNPKTINSINDGTNERLAVDASVTGVSEVNTDKDNDEVLIAGTTVAGDNAATSTAAQRVIVHVDSTGNINVVGDVAFDGVDAGNPVKVGGKAVDHGTTPTVVAAGDRTQQLANRQGIPFVMGGVPNVQTSEYNTTAAVTDDNIMPAIATGLKYVITRLTVSLDQATTVGVGIRIGFGSTTVPAEGASQADAVAGVLFSHPGLVPGASYTIGDGSGILGVGGDGEELRITATVPTSGKVRVNVSWYTVAS